MREKHGFKKEKKDRGKDRHKYGWCFKCNKVIVRGFADHMSKYHALSGPKVYATDEQIKDWRDKKEAMNTPIFGKTPPGSEDEEMDEKAEPNYSSYDSVSVQMDQTAKESKSDFKTP